MSHESHHSRGGTASEHKDTVARHMSYITAAVVQHLRTRTCHKSHITAAVVQHLRTRARWHVTRVTRHSHGGTASEDKDMSHESHHSHGGTASDDKDTVTCHTSDTSQPHWYSI